MTSLPPFQDVFLAHKDKIFGLIVKMVPNAAEAEDLTQQVFLRALRRYDDFRGDSEVSTWLYRIAVNLCTDYVRGKKVRPDAIQEGSATDEEDPGPLARIPDRSPSVEDKAVDHDVSDALRKTIARLDEKSREIILLREFEDMSYEDIARSLGITVDVVGVRLNRAREKLAKLMREFL